MIVSVDGGCAGVRNVKAGNIAATSQQYPLEMASLGVEAACRVREDRQEGIRLHRYRRDADHRQAEVWRRQQGHQVRHEHVLGRRSSSQRASSLLARLPPVATFGPLLALSLAARCSPRGPIASSPDRTSR